MKNKIEIVPNIQILNMIVTYDDVGYEYTVPDWMRHDCNHVKCDEKRQRLIARSALLIRCSILNN